MLVGPVVHNLWQNGHYFLFVHSWTTARFRQRGSKPEVSEDMAIFMNGERECRVLVELNIFLIGFLEFAVDHKLQLHFSQNELFWIGPVVHKGVQI